MEPIEDLFKIARPPRQAPEVEKRLMAFAEDYTRRQAALDQTAEQLREERDEAIRAAYKDGLPMQAIAKVVGLSFQRVAQIIRS